MANPDIVAVAHIYGGTKFLAPSTTGQYSLLNNAASSGLVYKVGSIVASNTSASAVNATVAYYNAAVTEGSTVSAGTAYPIAYQISVPPNASLVVTDKTTAFYLLENACVAVTSGTSNNLTFVVSYESITATA
jgi:hypothetical protein